MLKIVNHDERGVAREKASETLLVPVNETLQLVYARRAVDNPQPFCLFDVACPCLLHRGTLSVRKVGAAVLSVGLLQLPRRERVSLAYLSGATAYVLPREHTGTLLQRDIQHVVTLRGETDRKLESKRCLSHCWS